ncbi:MAG: hypothetical protein C4K60_10860 [Ideonella sp. MAG2]|nr:MAG: hypothetical protein C4K60_10860 [Ideonella sp. MAG2]
MCLAAAVLAGCGGGGGEPSANPVPEPPQGGTPEVPSLNLGRDSFYFAPNAKTSPEALQSIAGGDRVVASWNAYNDQSGEVLKPGLKVLFFGHAEGCQGGLMGPTEPAPSARLAQLSALTGTATDAVGRAMSWRPTAATAGCNTEVWSRPSASAVFVNASDTAGGVAMLTAKASVNGSRADVVQVKQQMMVTVYNHQCRQDNSAMPCQIQYLWNTAIVRSGVTDWSTQRWFQRAQVWFDPAQGSIPIVSGPLPASGVTTLEEDHGLSIWTSQGAASSHTPFAGKKFDATISFQQLSNVLRITTARKVGKSPGDVTDAEVAAVWGSRWAEPAAWSLLTSHVGQEVYNPDSQFRAEIGGNFSSLFVGPQ